MRSRLERIFAVLVLGLLVGLALTAQFLQPSSEPERGSAASAQPEGRRALLLLLRDLGYRAETWSEAPGSLPRGGGLLWMARAPTRPAPSDGGEELVLPESTPEGEPEGEPEKEEGGELTDPPPPPEPSPASLGIRSTAHYRRFLEEGGTIILRHDDGARAFLTEELGLAACEDVHSSRVAVPGVRMIRDSRGETLEIWIEEGGVLLPPPTGSSAHALWWGGTDDAEGEDVLAILVPIGSGQVVLLGADSFLDNNRIGQRDHALFAVRLAEEFARGNRVLFDEYALGLWRPRTAASLLTSPSLFLASAHLALLLLLAFWRSAWVREFPRDTPPLEGASSLLRARALAALLARAGKPGLLSRSQRKETG